MNNSTTFHMQDEFGNEVECEIIYTFHASATNKNYIIYTDNSVDEDGNIRVMASIYNPDADAAKLLPINTIEEWKMIESVWKDLQEESE